MIDRLKELLSGCKTDRAARAVIEKLGYKIIRDNTKDHNTFDVWIDDLLRVYKPYGRKEYIVQKWERVTLKYSGIPTFFSTGL